MTGVPETSVVFSAEGIPLSDVVTSGERTRGQPVYGRGYQ